MLMINLKHKAIFWSVLIVTLGTITVVVVSPPQSFPIDSIVTVSEGTLKDVSSELFEQGAIKYQSLFMASATLLGADDRLQAGEYLFNYPASTLRIAWRIAKGEYGIEPTQIRVPEGASRADIADLFEEELTKFNGRRFLEITDDKEGYLFPDTYFFLPTADAVTVARVLENTFTSRIEEFEMDLEESEYSLHEILTMASIIEREVSNPIDRRLVSGVLWNRISIDMALQVDASFVFILGKGSSELTLDDLETKSPYNTYTNRGLPPGPIGNPGTDAIEAALYPTSSNYFFYLSDIDGVTHYAETFEKHKQNKTLYLR